MQNKNIYLFFLIPVVLIALGTLRFNSQRTISAGSSNDTQMIAALQNYIRIKTVHPTPAYEKAINFLQTMAKQDGFEYIQLTLPSGNPVFVITYYGTDNSLPAIALNHHMDVVPAGDASKWAIDPFAGAIVDDVLIGRGVQDMKGIGIVHYFALKQLKERGIKPKRTIHIFAVPDEERGGFKGTAEFVKTDLFKKLNIGFVVDEGHASGNPAVFDLKISERKPLQILVECSGATHHGSHLCADNVIHELMEFLNKIYERHQDARQQVSKFQPGQLLSCNITSMQSGVMQENGTVAYNVIPAHAQATIDLRIPPSIKVHTIVEWLDATIAHHKNCTYQIKARALEEPEEPKEYSLLYKALSQAIEKYGMKTQPHYFEGASDLRFYLARGIDGVGFTPFTIEDNIHGINESVPVEQIVRARDIMYTFLVAFCT